MSQSEAPGVGATEGVREAKNYIDASYGVAFIEGGVERLGVPFRGLRFSWADGRSSLKPCSSMGRWGWRFHRSAQANLGWGGSTPTPANPSHWGCVRILTSVHSIWDGQGRCDGNVNPRTLRRLNRRGKDVSELLCGESTFSIEGSSWLFYQMLTGDLSTFSQPTHTWSLWSSFMVTWSHRWYLR